MDPRASRSLFRYFLPADSFVRILVRDPAPLDLRARPGLNRTGYRRLVIQACCPDFRESLPGRIRELCPLDPAAAEDLLYQLCIEVNPQLDIHTVRLPGEEEAAEEPNPELAQDEPDQWMRRLAARAHGLEERLSRRVIAQEAAVRALARAVRKAAAGLASERRPLGAFLFVGRTGTGKTELARALSCELYAGGAPTPGDALVRVDCSEYALAHEYSKLIGAPPGYVGHDQGGFLTEAVRKRPECVVLFDEIEKAHPKLHNLLLQVLDEGILSDSRGRRVDFTRSLVALTSNVGAADIQAATRRLGFSASPEVGESNLREITTRALEQTFSPEFLGRVDERIHFRELTCADAARIAERLLAELALRARRRGARVAFPRSVARWVAERGFAPDSGARELRRVIQRDVEAPLAELLLSGQPLKRKLVRATVRGGELRLAVAD